ncbi:hypothetical protein FSARC_5868 [Fusarium sarcochroum]|uniref:Uncharacterized protein n=1 Tax=Fusarium sarcochroum TaxID=1208366 RepID=A0A8H4TYK7_9HYPO|nr:hypothetical protein FSARC_5868 [Fusarium sarcochroum]
MHSATIFTTLALAASVIASPTPFSLNRRDGYPSFRISSARTYGNTCAVSNCIPIDYTNVVIESECGGKDCKAPSQGLDKAGSMCDKEIETCGRKVTLVSRGDGDCRKISDMKGDADGGKAYATISENGQDVGVCNVNLKESGAKTCGLAMGTTFTALIDCFFH